MNNIISVEKKYMDGVFTCYKVVCENSQEWFVPHDESNSDYQMILEWVAEGNTITDNGGGA